MPKYSTFKYGKNARYGRYDLTSSLEYMAQLQNVPFRLRTIDDKGFFSSAIVQTNVTISVDEKTNVRLKTNNGEFVYSDRISLSGKPIKTRIKSCSNKGVSSAWVECSIGRILPAKKISYTIEELSSKILNSDESMKDYYNRSTIIQSEIEKGVYLKDLENYKIKKNLSYRSNEPRCSDLVSLKFEDIIPENMATSGIKISKLERYSVNELKNMKIQDIIRYEMGRIKFE